MAGWAGFKDGYECVSITRLLRCIWICLSLPMNFPGQIQLRARAVMVERVGGSSPFGEEQQVGAGESLQGLD